MSKNILPISEIVLYQTEGCTVWLTQREMTELFDVSTDNIGLHLKNIYEDVELNHKAITEESSVIQLSRNP